MKLAPLTLLLLLPTLSHASPAEWNAPRKPTPRTITVATTPILTDPAADDITTQGNPIVDIRGLDAGSNGIALTIQLHFSSDTDMAQIGGTIELDTDQNPFTGFPPAANFYIPGSTEDIGVDYVLNLFGLLTGGPIEVYAVNRQTPEGTVPATITGQTLEFSVPLTMLGGDDGSMNVGMALGNAVQPTDAAPDSGHGTITAGPTPVSGSVRGVAPRKVVCTNLTTRQDVTLHLKGAATWDCEAAGLVVHPGDVVVQKVKGTAN